LLSNYTSLVCLNNLMLSFFLFFNFKIFALIFCCLQYLFILLLLKKKTKIIFFLTNLTENKLFLFKFNIYISNSSFTEHSIDIIHTINAHSCFSGVVFFIKLNVNTVHFTTFFHHHHHHRLYGGLEFILAKFALSKCCQRWKKNWSLADSSAIYV
jgi:hypothetical protein